MDGLLYWQSWLTAAETKSEAAAIVKRHIERPSEELYELLADPSEQRNLATDPAQSERLSNMRTDLDAWRKAQGDQQTVFGTPTLLGEPAPRSRRRRRRPRV